LEILRTIGTEKFMENPIDLYEKVHTCIAVPAVS
jgi:hypothetical protein